MLGRRPGSPISTFLHSKENIHARTFWNTRYGRRRICIDNVQRKRQSFRKQRGGDAASRRGAGGACVFGLTVSPGDAGVFGANTSTTGGGVSNAFVGSSRSMQTNADQCW